MVRRSVASRLLVHAHILCVRPPSPARASGWARRAPPIPALARPARPARRVLFPTRVPPLSTSLHHSQACRLGGCSFLESNCQPCRAHAQHRARAPSLSPVFAHRTHVPQLATCDPSCATDQLWRWDSAALALSAFSPCAGPTHLSEPPVEHTCLMLPESGVE